MAESKPPRGFRKAPEVPDEANLVRRQTARRERYETRNTSRMSGLPEIPGVSRATQYRMNGFSDQSPHPAGQMELPGMTSVATGRASVVMSPQGRAMDQSRTLPDLAPTPRRWEEMHPEEQRKTLTMARRYGVTPQSMERSLGAQVDQAHMRAGQHGQTPYASHFYSGGDPSRPSDPDEMQPRDRLVQSMKQNDTDFGTQVMANAITSPKSKFRSGDRERGVVYPNDEAANSAIQHAQRGGTPDNYTKDRSLQALTGNIKRAVGATRQRMAGASLSEVRNPGGTSPFGPKTGPYANSFIDPHGSSQFFVSDVHSGGGGMAPHLSHVSPYKRNEDGSYKLTASGSKSKDSSEREQYLAIPGIHALHDHVARKVASDRGLQSLSGLQATQWGEEQVQRGIGTSSTSRKQTLVKDTDAYPPARTRPEVSGQMDLFGGESRGVGAHVQSPQVRAIETTADDVSGRDRDRMERGIAARASATQKKRGALPVDPAARAEGW